MKNCGVKNGDVPG